MTTPESKARMLKGFDLFIDRITDRYQEARNCIEQGNYVEAQRILASLATSHARTSMSLRNFMIRKGFLPEDKS